MTGTIEKLETMARRARESADAARPVDELGAVLLDQAAAAYEAAASSAREGREKWLGYLTRRSGARRAAHGG